MADDFTTLQVLTAIKAMGLRPKPHQETPQRVKQVLETCWSNDPTERPAFDQVRGKGHGRVIQGGHRAKYERFITIAAYSEPLL